MNTEILKAKTLKELGIDKVLPAVYNDLLSPATQELGDGLLTIAKAVKIALAPIEATVWGYDKIKEWLSLTVTEKLAKRKATSIKTPPISISGPLILNMMFTSEEPDLRELYANLLASAMDEKTSDKAHPSFVTVIQQLTSDEAKIINYIATIEKDFPYWSGNSDAKIGSENDVWEQIRKVCVNSDIKYLENYRFYIENLIRLRIFKYQTENGQIEHHNGGSDENTDWDPYYTMKEYETIELTDFGRMFIDACVSISSDKKGV